MSTSFWVPGRPRTKGRPRFTKGGHTYTPPETKAAEEVISEAWPGPDHYKGPLAVAISFYPDGQYIDVRPHPQAKLQGILKRSDIDNLAKLTLDGLTKTEAFDDYQITRLVLDKYGEHKDG